MSRQDSDQDESHTARPGDGEPTHSPDGVDLTLIRWMLSLTPGQRLAAIQANVTLIESRRRHAGSKD
jgi:hypothetical protein